MVCNDYRADFWEILPAAAAKEAAAKDHDVETARLELARVISEQETIAKEEEEELHTGAEAASVAAETAAVLVLQHTATHCNALQRTATHCIALQQTATDRNTPQHTVTHCHTLQRGGGWGDNGGGRSGIDTTSQCNTL